MRPNLRFSAIFALFALVAVSTFAQDRPYAGTVVDVDAGRGRLQVESDGDATSRLMVETDSIATIYKGFGTMIAGKPEIFTGSAGLSNVRLGDRVEIRGWVRSEGIFRASEITLLGREVAAPQVGVGQTRPPTSATTPTDDRATGLPATGGTVEGTVRRVNVDEGHIVLQTPRRLMTVRTFRNTPVYYRGEIYRVTNLEAGDQIRVTAEPRDAQADEITASRIDVVRAVQDVAGGRPTGGTVTMLEGRVTRVDPGLDYAYVDTGRGEVRIDMRQAADAAGGVVRARDLRVGEMVEITGSYNRVGDMFLASTVRFGNEAEPRGGIPERDVNPFTRYGVVTLSGTVVTTLEDGPTISIRDTDAGTVDRVWVTPDFIVRTRANTYTTANTLRENDAVVISAFRDVSGNLVAQTIRLRTR